MLHLIVGFIVLVLGFFLIKALFRVLIKVIGGALALATMVLIGPAILASYIVERLAHQLHLRWILALVSVGIGLTVCYLWGVDDQHPAYYAYTFNSLKFVFPVVLAAVLLVEPIQKKEILQTGLENSDIAEVIQHIYCGIYTSYFLLAISAATHLVASKYEAFAPFAWWFGLGYSIVALLALLYSLIQLFGMRMLTTEIVEGLKRKEAINSQQWLIELQNDAALQDEWVEMIFLKLLTQNIMHGETRDLELAGENWLLNTSWYEQNMREFDEQLRQKITHSSEELRTVFHNRFDLPPAANEDFLNRHLTNGDYYSFSNDRKFVSFHNVDELCTCASCGISSLKKNVSTATDDKEWLCSDICRETENLCQDIYNRPYEEFISSLTTNGLILVTLPEVWSNNVKMFAAGGQGHGFAAERGNHAFDKALLKSASIVGDDNATNGADRLVNGIEIQTKYCATAARSVGAAFDGQNGMYRYYNSDGAPMQLEVPKDQYPRAIETMAKKIREGKVNGYTNPADASKLVRAGHLTYAQAKNITKFGTYESIIYDAYEGSIVSLTAGGISFGLTAGIYYLNIGDRRVALQTAAIQSGKAITRTMGIYITTQQLHRIHSVQALLKHVDFASTSPTVVNALQRGMGAKDIRVLNKMMRGTLVTSFAVVAITTGPDMIKMVRGRISGAQFLKNLAITTTGVGGGVVGSIAGGVLLSGLGPIGMLAGRMAGGFIGGALATQVSKKITGAMGANDKVKVLGFIQAQVELLATRFLMTENEIENLNANLSKILDQTAMETIYANREHGRAAANMLIKPLVVGVMKQRPVLNYDQKHIIEMIDEIEPMDLPLSSAA